MKKKKIRSINIKRREKRYLGEGKRKEEKEKGIKKQKGKETSLSNVPIPTETSHLKRTRKKRGQKEKRKERKGKRRGKEQ